MHLVKISMLISAMLYVAFDKVNILFNSELLGFLGRLQKDIVYKFLFKLPLFILG